MNLSVSIIESHMLCILLNFTFSTGLTPAQFKTAEGQTLNILVRKAPFAVAYTGDKDNADLANIYMGYLKTDETDWQDKGGTFGSQHILRYKNLKHGTVYRHKGTGDSKEYITYLKNITGLGAGVGSALQDYWNMHQPGKITYQAKALAYTSDVTASVSGERALSKKAHMQVEDFWEASAFRSLVQAENLWLKKKLELEEIVAEDARKKAAIEQEIATLEGEWLKRRTQNAICKWKCSS